MRVAIDQSTIDRVADAVSNLGDATAEARGMVDATSRVADNLENGVDTIKREFAAYREYDTQQNNLQNAKAEIVKVRMELDSKYGINKEIRRYLTGILEASDLSLVKKDVIANCTEQIMLDCKNYWLAPCLVALSAWFSDNKPLADRALNEAMKRDDERTSLLFALICRRVNRPDASIKWLERYLAMQDPKAVERKLVTVLDAYSNGLFGAQARDLCESKIENWIAEMTAEEGFVESQRANWEEAIYSKLEHGTYDGRYPYSSKYVKNWSACVQSLNETDLHRIILEYFKDIFEKKSGSATALNDRLDQLLENYISSYDNEELPLRRKERELELIIEERGDVNRAQARFKSEQKAMDEILDFTQLLTSAAMHADVIKASNATQRLAIALSKEWVVSAYDNTVLGIRSRFPGEFQLEIEGWTGKTVDGSEENDLMGKAETYFNSVRDSQIDAIQQSKLDIVLPILFAVASIFGFTAGGFWGFLLLIGAGGFGLKWFLKKQELERQRQSIRDQFAEIVVSAKKIIKALCAERVDYIRQLKEQDKVSDETSEYIRAINPVQFVEHAGGREIH